MDIPGVSGQKFDPEAADKAEAQSARLLDELKEAVQVEVRDIGVLRKELQITVPAQIIADNMKRNYDELSHDAFIPGFRKGHAPRKLIEKRYGSDVRESLTTTIVGQSFLAATENKSLEVLGDPVFRVTTAGGEKLVDFQEALTTLKLPESGDFAYSCEVEVKPAFELPPLEGIPVRAPKVEITDAMVSEQFVQQRKIRGRLEPVADGAAEVGDQVVADFTLAVGGEQIKHEENLVVPVRPTWIGDIPFTDLGQQLAGARTGDTRAVECTIPPDFERPDLRGQRGQCTFKINEVKRLVPEPVADFLRDVGFDSEAEALEYYRDRLEAQRGELVQRAMKAQVEDYLVQNTTLDLPESFSARQTERAVVRRLIELQQQGVPMTDVEARIDELRTSAKPEVMRDLKLAFVLEKVCEKLDIQVTDEEVNTEIAQMARRYNRRFDRVRDDLQNRDLLDKLVEQIRHDKCIEQLLQQASVTDAGPDAAAAGADQPAGQSTK